MKALSWEDLNGIYGELAELIGTEAARCIYENYRGQQVTFPVRFLCREYTVAQIIAEARDHSVKELATKYGYSEKTIRKILKEAMANL